MHILCLTHTHSYTYQLFLCFTSPFPQCVVCEDWFHDTCIGEVNIPFSCPSFSPPHQCISQRHFSSPLKTISTSTYAVPAPRPTLSLSFRAIRSSSLAGRSRARKSQKSCTRVTRATKGTYLRRGHMVEMKSRGLSLKKTKELGKW